MHPSKKYVLLSYCLFWEYNTWEHAKIADSLARDYHRDWEDETIQKQRTHFTKSRFIFHRYSYF